MDNEMPRQSAAASSAAQSGEQSCEVIATHAVVTRDSVEPVSPPVSPAISLAIAEGREQPKPRPEAHKSSSQSGSECGNGNTKANCYECKHRRELVGDAHSSCCHPGASPIAILLFAAGQSEMKTKQIHVRGNTHGVRSGWFLWPMNFDPCWLEICSGFERSDAAGSKDK